MNLFNYSIFLCDCCQPSKPFRNLSALQQHEKASRPIQDVTVKEEPKKALAQVAVVQTTELPPTKTLEGAWSLIMCQCCNPGEVFSNLSDLVHHINNRINGVNASIIATYYQAPVRVSDATVEVVTTGCRPRPMPMVGLSNCEKTLIGPKPLVVTTMEQAITKSMPNVDLSKSEKSFIRPMPIATTMKTLVAESGPIIGQSLSENMCIKPEPYEAITIESPMTGSMHNIDLHKFENTFIKPEPFVAKIEHTMTESTTNTGLNDPNDSILKCVYCEVATKTEPELHEHIQEHWRKGEDRVCPLCKKQFLSITNLVRHLIKCPMGWKCVYCEVNCETELELHLHIGDHWRKNENHSCPRCDRPFTTIHNLLRHHRNCSPSYINKYKNKRLKCVYCENICKSKTEWREHMEKHWREDTDRSCQFCKRLFTSLTHLIRHHMALHLVQCPTCKESTQDEKSMIEHLRSHETEHSIHYCKKCKGEFGSGALFLKHAKSHVMDRFLCDLCERSFREKCELKLHITEIHLRLANLKYRCTECPRSYSSENILKQHIYLKHGDDVPIYKCSECGKQYKHKSKFNEHILRHAGLTPYACDKCDRQFANQRQLSAHMESHREPSKCSHCPKMYKDVYLLREHERTHVGNPELFQCSFCEKTFTVRRYMERHEKRIHLEERPQCSICKKTFSSTDYLRKHFSAVHEDGGGYGCSVCEKRFSLKKDVEIHEALHRPEKPFKCTYCPYACRNQSNLRKHMKIHNKGKKSAKSKK